MVLRRVQVLQALLAGRDGDLVEIWAALELEDSLVVRSTCKRGFIGFSKSDGAKSLKNLLLCLLDLECRYCNCGGP